jgi:hypothetical protein
MRKSLAEETSPLDACLEAVLPGVHQWHQANNTAINQLGERVDSMATCISTGIQAVIDKIDSSDELRTQKNDRLASLLEMGSHLLRNGNPDGLSQVSDTSDNHESNSRSRRTAITPVAITQDMDLDENKNDQHSNYRMRPKHQQLMDLYAEWIGDGDFADDFGGIKGQNKRFNASWRKHLAPYLYSRTERTIKGVRAYATENGLSPYDACEQLQPEYEKQKCSVANMVNYFTAAGLLTKRKPRGKKVNKNSRTP